MHSNQALKACARNDRSWWLSLKTAFAILFLTIASAVQASDDVTGIAAPANAPALDESPQVENVAAVLSRHFRVARQEATLIAQAVLGAANQYAVSPVLLLAVIATESGFDRQAVSAAGAQGLMQILPAAHPQLIAASHDLTEPVENVRIGSSILRQYLDASGGDLGIALRRYSGGGKGYAQRVALHMRQFSSSLHASGDEPVKAH
jgi:soluble lytic murein transglycosylase-like protein